MDDFCLSIIMKMLKRSKRLSDKTNLRRKRKTGLETINRFKYQSYHDVTKEELDRVKLRYALLH